MPIARTRLRDDLTVKQLVEKLVSTWGDDENDVLKYLADRLEEDTRRRGDDGIVFYYKHPVGMENEDGSLKYPPLKIPFGNIIHALRVTAENDEWGIEDKRFYVFADEHRLKYLSMRQGVFGQRHSLSTNVNIKVSLRDIFVNKFDITSFLLDNNLPVPQGWRGIVAPGDGLDQSAQSKAASGTTPHRDDETGKRIQSVLEKAAEIKAKNQHLSIAGIANQLAKRYTTGKFEQYGFESIRKILSGTFGPAKTRGIRGLEA